VLNLILLLGELGLVEAKLMLGQFFDFRFVVNASRFFHLPHPIQTLHNLRDPRCPSRNSLLPRFSLLPLGDTIENEYEKTNSLSRRDIRLTSSCHLWRRTGRIFDASHSAA
jgi:hypothetical protein